MSQTAITRAFEQWKAQQAATGIDVVLDEFVFANIPGLDVSVPIDRAETLPDASMIVHRQSVTKTGLVNENAVVYSVVLGTDTGDFSFNWIGLVNQASGTLAMIVHAPVQQKIKTAAGQQGNVLTRSFLMEYNGAATETQINTPVETWQIDFTARLDGVDERTRLENIDLYGAASFFDNGYLVTKTGAQYYVTPGVGYIAGLRSELPQKLSITVPKKPASVWLDVAWRGSLTSVWSVESKVTVAEVLADYEQDGVKHYVFAVARIEQDGTITDLRPKNGRFLEKTKNLSDLTDISAARDILGLKEAALMDVGQATGTVAAGDDPRITGALQSENNFSDLNDVAVARDSLGLKGAALLDVGQVAGTVAAGDDPRITGALQRENNFSDLTSVPKAISNLGLTNIVLAGIATGYLYDTGMFELPLIIAGKREKVIVQWGMANNNASATTTTNFVTPFPRQCFVVIPVGYQVAGNIQAYVTLNSKNRSFFTWNAFYGQGGTAPVMAPRVGDVTCFYIAIGI